MISKTNELQTLLKKLGITIHSLPGIAYLDFDRAVTDALKKLEEVPYIPYPVSFATCDIIPYNFTKGALLGRKPGQELFQIIGGFRDPGESSEKAAKRELAEETFLVITDELVSKNSLQILNCLEYLGSFPIDDKRYENSPHKISTNAYKVLVEKDVKPKGGDDIEEVQWFTFSMLNNKGYRKFVRDLHWVIIDKFLESFDEI